MDAPKVKRRYRYLGAGIITAIIIALAWTGVKAVAVADRQRSKLGELEQARARWEARPFSGYRLLIQAQPYGASTCEQAFEVDEPAQTKTLSDTCPDDSRASFLMKSLGSPRTVPDLFDYIKAEIGRVGACAVDGCACTGATTIDVVYDTDLGYPKRMEVRFYQDWTTKGLCRGIAPVGYISGPFTVSVDPTE
jgi:hypothetical protein